MTPPTTEPSGGTAPPGLAAALRGHLTTTVLAVLFAVSMEWLFFATKPSFMSGMAILGKLRLLMTTAAPLVLAGVVIVSVIVLAGHALRLAILQRAMRFVAQLVPSLALASTLFVMIDNFTLTVFGYGIRNTGALMRWPYVLVALALVWLCQRFVAARIRALQASSGVRSAAPLAAGLVVLSVVICGVESLRAADRLRAYRDHVAASPMAAEGRPNVLLIASDGLDATHMSAYGYQRKTTPAIESIARQSLVAENAFSNSGQTGASVTSLLTGKLPTQTRLIFPPDILRGENSYQHLPGILARHGYRNIDVSLRHYADAYDLNMRGGFAWANGRAWDEFQLPAWVTQIFGDSAYLIEQMSDRHLARVLHVAGVRRMPNPFHEVQADRRVTVALDHGWGPAAHQGDLVRLNLLFQFIDTVQEPFFAHVQLFGTHGPAYPISKRVFSVGQEQRSVWMDDFYDDAILQFDANFAAVLDFLRARGKLNNTLIVLHSDHGQRWETGVRIPLILRFPRAAYAGRIRENVQNIDIAPTILDYLGIPIPEWMLGQSLLSGARDPLRPVLCPRMYAGLEMKQFRRGPDFEEPPPREPPFYRIEVVTVVICHRVYRLHLATNRVDTSEVPQHTAPCAPRHLATEAQVRQLVAEHLRTYGYDASSISPP